MSLEKSQAIVLRTVPWSETSLIVTLLTRDYGKISAVAKGARRLKGPFEGSLDLLSVCTVNFIDKSGEVLDILTESKLLRRFRSASRSLDALNAGYYVAEVLQRTTEADRQLVNLYDLSDATLLALDEGQSVAATVIRFELHALSILGHAPQLTECVACGVPLPATAAPSGGGRGPPRTAFSHAAGGVICDACLPGHREVVRVDDATISVLQRILATDWRSGEPGVLPTRAIIESRQLLNRLFRTLLDRPIEVAGLLDNLPQ